MRFRLFLCLAVLLPQLQLSAHDSDFPTLDALAKAEVPPFTYANMARRMLASDRSHTPSDNPPRHDIGYRELFRLRKGEDYKLTDYVMELRAQTERVVIWAQHDVNYPKWRAESLARRVELYAMDPVEKRFKAAEPPGVDGDPRLNIALVNDPDGPYGGYFARKDTSPRKLDIYSNQRELIVINLAKDDEYDFYDDILIDFVAHEYTHVLQYHSDAAEELWLNEGLATYAGFQAAKPFLSRSTGHVVADEFLESPDVGLTQWYSVEDKNPKYGAAFLFVTYLSQRFGDEIAPRLLAEQTRGWRSIVTALPEYTDISADEVFADWVLANYFLDDRRGYGYRELDAELTPPAPTVSLNSFPAQHSGELPQYATEYISVDVRGADKLRLRLRQAPVAKLFDAYTSETGSFAYAISSEHGHPRLTRAFNLATSRHLWLEFRFWHDLDEDLEYAYVTISTDRGESWQTLSGRYTKSSAVLHGYYAAGYTDALRSWRNESIDLSRYAPGEVLISFELMSEFGASYGGIAIDDVHIRTVNYHEYFDSFDDGWTAEGWIITDNRLPNNTWLQVVQDTGDQLHISRELLAGDGELTVELLPGVSNALVAVSPVVPQTSLPSEYVLEAKLLNAADEVLRISRECTLTTTDALNFRDAPSGNKIGLLLKGTAVDALGRQGDWFQVDHKGAVGWVHGDYVTRAGNCP